MFFDATYVDEEALTETDPETGATVSSLLLLPYSMNFCGESLGVAYVYGAGTLKKFRAKGHMGRLLKRSLREASERGDSLAVNSRIGEVAGLLLALRFRIGFLSSPGTLYSHSPISGRGQIYRHFYPPRSRTVSGFRADNGAEGLQRPAFSGSVSDSNGGHTNERLWVCGSVSRRRRKSGTLRNGMGTT